MEIVEHVDDLEIFIKSSAFFIKKKWNNVCCYN